LGSSWFAVALVSRFAQKVQRPFTAHRQNRPVKAKGSFFRGADYRSVTANTQP
jgi:hypothetical protein